MWSATIRAGGRPAAGIAAQSLSAAPRNTAKARSPASRSAGSAPTRNAGFEHRRVERRLGAGEFEIGLAEPVQRGESVGAAVVPGPRQRRLELLEAAQRHTRHQFVAVAEMPIGRRRADAGEARRLGESEAGRAPSWRSVPAPRGSAPRADCRDDSRAARRARRVVLAPTHVKGLYIRPADPSMLSDLRGSLRREGYRLNWLHYPPLLIKFLKDVQPDLFVSVGMDEDDRPRLRSLTFGQPGLRSQGNQVIFSHSLHERTGRNQAGNLKKTEGMPPLEINSFSVSRISKSGSMLSFNIKA